jgi:hypothetical protein
MLSKIYKSEWIPIFGQSFVLIELDSVGQGERFGKIVTVTFHGDRKNVTVTPLSVSAKLPLEFFSDETVMNELAIIGQNNVRNQIYEFGKKLNLDWLTYLPDLSFSDSSTNSLLFAITQYRAFDIFDKLEWGSSGEFFNKFSGLKWKKETWSFKLE